MRSICSRCYKDFWKIVHCCGFFFLCIRLTGSYFVCQLLSQSFWFTGNRNLRCLILSVIRILIKKSDFCLTVNCFFQGRIGFLSVLLPWWIQTRFKQKYVFNCLNKYFDLPKVLQGNIDYTSAVGHNLNPPIVARFIKINVKEFVGYPSLRVELFGCTKGMCSIINEFPWKYRGKVTR